MPRRPDPDLEDRILNAAQKLWKKGAEKTLTMRAVAKAASTNTPAVYRRFKNREDILRALLQRIRQQVVDLLEASPSPEEACERYLEFALTHAHEYELFYHEYELFFSAQSASRNPQSKTRSTTLTKARPAHNLKRPGFEAFKNKLAGKLGGTPNEHTRLALALWGLAHGTAMLLIGGTILPEYGAEARSAYKTAVTVLIRQASTLAGT
jgi:AcrR family transcriptional regulator